VDDSKVAFIWELTAQSQTSSVKYIYICYPAI
jgi:hypothetical protein